MRRLFNITETIEYKPFMLLPAVLGSHHVLAGFGSPHAFTPVALAGFGSPHAFPPVAFVIAIVLTSFNSSRIMSKMCSTLCTIGARLRWEASFLGLAFLAISVPCKFNFEPNTHQHKRIKSFPQKDSDILIKSFHVWSSYRVGRNFVVFYHCLEESCPVSNRAQRRTHIRRKWGGTRNFLFRKNQMNQTLSINTNVLCKNNRFTQF